MRTTENWLDHCTEEMKAADLFFGHGTDNAHDEAAWMLLHVMAAPLDGSFVQWNTVLNTEQEAALEQLLAGRINQRCPLAYLTGEARFCGLDFIVTTDVLIPRSPLAEVIQERFSPWVDLSKGGTALDMCTGGACIAIAMALYMPGINVTSINDPKRD